MCRATGRRRRANGKTTAASDAMLTIAAPVRPVLLHGDSLPIPPADARADPPPCEPTHSAPTYLFVSTISYTVHLSLYMLYYV